jgi:hypothetical protein
MPGVTLCNIGNINSILYIYIYIVNSIFFMVIHNVFINILCVPCKVDIPSLLACLGIPMARSFRIFESLLYMLICNALQSFFLFNG